MVNVVDIIYRTKESLDLSKYFIATYELEGSKSLDQAAFELSIGQSAGNPHCRSVYETDELFKDHCCKIIIDTDKDKKYLESVKSGIVEIAFPIINTNWVEDGISHLLVQLMGGNLDIAQITKCRLVKLELPQSVVKTFKGPKFGLDYIRSYTNVYNRPLLGGILKPKTGVSSDVLLEMVQEMVYGGVSFIKEDEILANPSFCTIEDRVPKIMKFINDYYAETGRHVIYAVCINADYPYALERVKRVYELGANAIHINFWCGLGTYKAIRDLDLPLFVHYQTSGLKILTDMQHRFSIDFNVICQLAGLSGVSFMHIGMLFGYSGNTEDEIKQYVETLHKYNVCPTMSCGLSKDNVNKVTDVIGIDYLANSGGAIHSHPEGTRAGAKAIDDAIIGHMAN